MKVKITYPDGTVQVETAFNSVEEAISKLFTNKPANVKVEGEEPVEVKPAPVEVKEPEVKAEAKVTKVKKAK